MPTRATTRAHQHPNQEILRLNLEPSNQPKATLWSRLLAARLQCYGCLLKILIHSLQHHQNQTTKQKKRADSSGPDVRLHSALASEQVLKLSGPLRKLPGVAKERLQIRSMLLVHFLIFVNSCLLTPLDLPCDDIDSVGLTEV